MRPLLAWALALHAAAATAGAGGRQPLNPTLQPKSDERFFGHDYPHDKAPEAGSLKFSYPYPLVEDDGFFDKDYVRDENGDAGEWSAQMEYDRVRAKLTEQQAKTAAKFEKQRQARQDMLAAQAEEAKAEAEAKEAEVAADKARQRHQAANDKVEELIGKAGGKQLGGHVGEAVGKVNHEITDVEGCQEQLRVARTKLKGLVEAKDARQRALEKEREAAAKGKAVAEAEYAAARDALHGQMDKELARRVEREEEAHKRALAELDAKEKEMRKIEEQIREAAQSLHELRSKEDPGGGITYRGGAAHERSGAAPAAALPPWLLASAVALLAASSGAGGGPLGCEGR